MGNPGRKKTAKHDVLQLQKEDDLYFCVMFRGHFIITFYKNPVVYGEVNFPNASEPTLGNRG